jgi:hypothetical protein
MDRAFWDIRFFLYPEEKSHWLSSTAFLSYSESLIQKRQYQSRFQPASFIAVRIIHIPGISIHMPGILIHILLEYAHRTAIAAMDFFTVPTITFGVLYCFFIIGHDRRKILSFNVTRNPNAAWIVQQMREAWPYAPTHRFLLFDHDSKFGKDVISGAKDMGSRPVRTALRVPGRTE